MLHLTNAAMLLAQEGTDEPGTNVVAALLPFILIGLIFYFLMIAPQRRRMRRLRGVRADLNVGDEIRTVGGIHGVIRTVDGEEVTIDVGGGTTLRLLRRAIAERLGDDSA